jgi:hypothetical protein
MIKKKVPTGTARAPSADVGRTMNRAMHVARR